MKLLRLLALPLVWLLLGLAAVFGFPTYTLLWAARPLECFARNLPADDENEELQEYLDELNCPEREDAGESACTDRTAARI